MLTKRAEKNEHECRVTTLDRLFTYKGEIGAPCGTLKRLDFADAGSSVLGFVLIVEVAEVAKFSNVRKLPNDVLLACYIEQ